MKNKELTTNETPSESKNLSRLAEREETQSMGLQLLSERFDQADGLPESLLISSAQRLSNLAHSLYENREKAYLESDDVLPVVDSCRVDDICKLAEAASKQMVIALQFKKERISAMKVIDEVLRK